MPANGKKAKWKKESDALRNAMHAGKLITDAKAQGKDLKDVDFGSVPQEEDDRCGTDVGKVVAHSEAC